MSCSYFLCQWYYLRKRLCFVSLKYYLLKQFLWYRTKKLFGDLGSLCFIGAGNKMFKAAFQRTKALWHIKLKKSPISRNARFLVWSFLPWYPDTQRILAKNKARRKERKRERKKKREEERKKKGKGKGKENTQTQKNPNHQSKLSFFKKKTFF